MNKFLVKIPCKPYVRRFLEINYGDPLNLGSGRAVDISRDKILYEDFRKKLEKQSFRYDNKYSNFELYRYSDEVAIKIKSDDFYRYGWDLSKTDVVAFNKTIESRAKVLMYTIVGTHVAMGVALSDSIDHFQERFSFTEDVWPKESIYKDCQRNLDIKRNHIIQDLSHLIDKISMVKLSENRTTSHKLKRVYENNNV